MDPLDPESPDPRIFPISGGRKRGSTAEQDIPAPPREPAEFDASADPILRKTKLTDKQFNKFVKQLSYYLLTHGGAEWARSMVDGLSRGRARDMNRFEEMFGLVKSGDGFVFNFHQNNLSVNNGGNARDFDALLREIDRADREAMVVDVSPAQPMIERGAEVVVDEK